MRRLVVLMAVLAAVTAVAGGTALAATLACNGGRCVGGNGPDTMYGSAIRDQIYGRGGGDYVRGSASVDFLDGGGGNDELLGGQDGDTVNGVAGNDLIAGNQGNDRLSGGTGNDRIEAADGRRDTINCGPGPNDVVVFDARIDRFADCEILEPR